MRRTIAQLALVFTSVLLTLALVGCGGSSKTPASGGGVEPDPMPTPPPAPMAINGLPSGHTLEAGTIPAGESRAVSPANAVGIRTTVTCPAGGAACVIAVADNGSATATGGQPTVTTTYFTAINLPSGHILPPGTIPAGTTRDVSPANAGGVRTIVTCPSGGAACVVTVTASGAESTGGAITVTTHTAIATLELPTGHGLRAGTTIPAGESLQVHDDGEGERTTVTCAAGGPACVVNLVAGTLEWTGGALSKGTIEYTTLQNLPSGHRLAAGTIPAGTSRDVSPANAMGSRTTVMCPSGGAACVIAVADDGSVTATGGTPEVTTISFTAISLPSGHTLAAGTIPAGGSRTVSPANAGGVRTIVTCPSGGAACVVTLTASGAESTGGAITVATHTPIASLELPTGHTLAAGTIPAGESRRVHDNQNGTRTTVMCAAGGPACVVNSAAGTLEWTGGTLRKRTITYTTLQNLPSGHSLMTGTIPAGESRDVSDANGMRTTVTCPADGEDCAIEVADGSATSTGGTPEVTMVGHAAIQLPDGHELTAGTMLAGEMRVALDANGSRTVVTCPGGTGAEACVVTLTASGAESTGGRITVETYSYAAVAGLPGDHTLITQTIPAGSDVRVPADYRGRRFFVSCPGGADAPACDIVVEDGSVESRRGVATVRTETNGMVWHANNGPDEDSNGEHARGFLDRVRVNSGTSPAYTNLGAVTEATVAATAVAPHVVQGLAQGTVTDWPTAVVRWTRGTSPMIDLTLATPAFTILSPGGQAGELVVDSTSETPSLGTGWNGRSLSGGFLRESKAMYAVVYTDAEEPTGYVAGQEARTVSRGLDLSVNSDVTAAFAQLAQVQALEFDVSSSIGTDVKVTIPVATMRTLLQGGTQTDLGDVTVSYKDADGDSQTRTAEMECATTCRSMRGGANQGLTGDWNIEIPSVTEVPGTQDLAYLILGSWLVLPENASSPEDNIASYNLGSFAYSAVVPGAPSGARQTQTNLDARLVGTPRYTGRAAGLYVTGSVAGTGSSRRVTNAEVGSFTADAALTTTHDGTNFTGVSGTVTNFMEDGNSLGWSMELEDTGQGSAGTIDVFTGTTNLETTSGLEANGNWGVQFHWEDGAGVEHAAGTFNASTPVDPSGVDRGIHVVGAFGAENPDN